MIKLFILPYAGGNSFYFREVKKYLDKDIKVKYVTIPGRKNGKNDVVYHNITEMAEAVSDEIERNVDGMDYAIFGHSLGSLLAYEIYYVLEQRNLNRPKHMFFSGMMAPTKLSFYNQIRNKMAHSVEMKNQGVMSAYEMDMSITNQYIWKSHSEIQTDVTVLYGKMDEFIQNEKDIKQWGKLVSEKCEFYAFDGGHYYFEEESQKEELGCLVNRILNEYC